MNLKKGMSIDSLLNNNYDNVQINSGVSSIKNTVPEKVNFQNISFRPKFNENAYLVKKDWRKLSSDEIKTLTTSDKCSYYNTVCLGKLPKEIINLFDKSEINKSSNKEEVMSSFKQKPSLTKSINDKLHFFLKNLSKRNKFHIHCISINLPNLEMVGCDTTKLPDGFKPEDVKYMGIHVDCSQPMSLHTAYKYGNRISFNLGCEKRSLFFINLTMIQVYNMVMKVYKGKEKLTMYNIKDIFFNFFPNYPVIKIDINPYEYYIAPTDNCFHDGSTLGKTSLDINLIYFGSFKH